MNFTRPLPYPIQCLKFLLERRQEYWRADSQLSYANVIIGKSISMAQTIHFSLRKKHSGYLCSADTFPPCVPAVHNIVLMLSIHFTEVA